MGYICSVLPAHYSWLRRQWSHRVAARRRPSGTPAQGGGQAKLLKDEDLYRYEGEGTAKKKVEISRRERRTRLIQATQGK